MRISFGGGGTDLTLPKTILASISNWTAAASPAPWLAPGVSSLLVLTCMQLIVAWFLAVVARGFT